MLLRHSLDSQPWEDGIRLKGSTGDVLCSPREFVDGGDHWIMMGDVQAVNHPDHPAKPLVFYRGNYHSLAQSDPN